MKYLYCILVFLTFILLAGGCTSMDDEFNIQPNDYPSESSVHGYSLDQILSRASKYYNMLPGRLTRSVTPGIKNIELISHSVTRAENDSMVYPMYYIVNYENDEGFVIVGANQYAEEMVAVSDEGNLNLSDTINNPGLTGFFNEINSGRYPFEPVLAPDTTIHNDPLVPELGLVSVSPLISKNVRKWGQGAPFNSFTPLINGRHAKTGCAPLSFAILMTYYEWPLFAVEGTSPANVYNIDWKEIKNNSYVPMTGKILEMLGNDFETEYGIDYSGSDLNNYNVINSMDDNLMNHWNYNYAFPSYETRRELKNFDFSSSAKVKSQLPMVVWAKHPTDKSHRFPDSWVIDGVLHISSVYDDNATYDYDDYYFHCIWGNYGSGNGYFKHKYVNSIGGSRHSKDNNDEVYDGYTDTGSVPVYSEGMSSCCYLVINPIYVGYF